MKIKKTLGFLLSLALILGMIIPDTLMVSADETGMETVISTEGEENVPDTEEFSSEEEQQIPSTESSDSDTENGNESDEGEQGEVLETPSCDCGTTDGNHAESCPLYKAPEDPAKDEEAGNTDSVTGECTCGTTDGNHAEDCPLYEAPEVPSEGGETESTDPEMAECTCGTTDGKHAEDCPLYEEPETEEGPSLFERIMECTTLEEIDAVLAEATEEEFDALTEEEIDEIEAYIESLEPEPLPAVVLEKSEDEPVESEIIYPTVNFSNVAPFSDAVAE